MILLTGASGFIGSYLLIALKDKYGYDNVVALTSKPLDGYRFLLHNNYSFQNDFFQKNGYGDIEIILHAGAFTPKNSNEANIISKCNQNIENTYRLLTTKLPKLKKIVYLSTLDVYGETESTLVETSQTNPQSLYGASKLYCENMIGALAIQNDIEGLVLRIGHVYGPGEQEYKKLIPEVMRNLINGKEISIWGSGNEIRSFIYIDDVVNAIITSLHKDKIDSPINIVSDEAITIRNVVETIIKVSEKSIILNKILSNHKPRNLIFDNSKMRKMLYEPKTSFEIGIKKEWEVFKKLYEKTNF